MIPYFIMAYIAIIKLIMQLYNFLTAQINNSAKYMKKFKNRSTIIRKIYVYNLSIWIDLH